MSYQFFIPVFWGDPYICVSSKATLYHNCDIPLVSRVPSNIGTQKKCLTDFKQRYICFRATSSGIGYDVHAHIKFKKGYDYEIGGKSGTD